MDNSDTRRSVRRPRDQRVSSGRVLIVASKVPRNLAHDGVVFANGCIGKIELRFSPRSRFGREKRAVGTRVRGR
jgi:hypothetical protein